MKRLLLLLPVLFLLLASCEVTVIEEPVPVVHDVRDHFLGYYDVEEYDVTSGSYTEYTFDVSKSLNDPYTIFIGNFYGVGIEVVAEVDGYDVYIPEQTVDGFHIEGDGYLEGNELILNYSVHDHLDSHSHVHYYEVSAFK